MSRVTSLTAIPEQQLDRWIKRLALLLLVGIVAFIAFYTYDRWRPATPAIVDRELTTLEEAVRKDPADVASRGRLGDLYFAQGRYDDAVAQYSALIDANKGVELAKLGRARAYKELGRLDEAAADFQAVVDIARSGEMANADPYLEAAYYGLGSVVLAQGRPKDAIDPLSRALAIQRTDADALNAIGRAYVGTGDYDRAIQALRKAVALVPTGWSEPYATLATAYSAAGKADLAEWAGAMAAFESGDRVTAEQRLLELAAGGASVDADVGLGLVMETKGDSAAAADWYRKALAIEPANVSAQLGLSRVRGVDASAHPSAGAEGSN